MKFTIIIPTLNAEEKLHKTLESLATQTYRDFECLIMDGGSTDTTSALIENYQASFPALYFYSAADKGIYDAMNKGVSLAKGEFVLFLGAGDSLHNVSILETVSKHLQNEPSDILYGDILLLPETVCKQPCRLNNRYFRSGKMICHQSIFARTETLTEYPFSLEYIYGSDRDWLIRSFLNNKSFCHIPAIIADYDTTGFTSDSKNHKAVWMESGKILSKHYGKFMSFITFVKYYLVVKWQK